LVDGLVVPFLGFLGVCLDAEFLDPCPQLACREVRCSLSYPLHHATCRCHCEVTRFMVNCFGTAHIDRPVDQHPMHLRETLL
jgi:hypothetical protein